MGFHIKVFNVLMIFSNKVQFAFMKQVVTIVCYKVSCKRCLCHTKPLDLFFKTS